MHASIYVWRMSVIQKVEYKNKKTPPPNAVFMTSHNRIDIFSTGVWFLSSKMHDKRYWRQIKL